MKSHLINNVFVCLVGTLLLLSCGGGSPKTESDKDNTEDKFRQALLENTAGMASKNEASQKKAEQREAKAEAEAAKRKTIIDALLGTWVYKGKYNGYNITSELRFTNSRMEWYINGEEAYSGIWDFDWDKNSGDLLILYNPVSSTNWSDVFVYDLINGIEFDEGRYFKKSNRKLNYEQSSSSSNSSFSSDYDVYSYLSSHSFSGGNVRVSFGNGGTVMYANGNQLSNAMVVNSFNSHSALLSYTSPFSPGTHYIRIDNKTGTLTDGDGNVYYSR